MAKRRFVGGREEYAKITMCGSFAVFTPRGGGIPFRIRSRLDLERIVDQISPADYEAVREQLAPGVAGDDGPDAA